MWLHNNILIDFDTLYFNSLPTIDAFWRQNGR